MVFKEASWHQNPMRVTSSCLQQCWAPAVCGLWLVCPNIPSQPLRGFSASLEWSLLERRLWTVWATDEISSTLQILQGGIWEEHCFSPALKSWLITQEALFSANETVLVFDCCEPDIPNSFFFDQCPPTCLKANLLQYTIDENHHLNGSCRFLFFLKIIYLKGGNLRNCMMPRENISDGFFAKMIKIGKIRKRKQRINPGKGSCLKRTSAVAKTISGRVLVQVWEPQMAVRGSFQKMNYFQCFVFMSVKRSIHRACKPDHGSEDSTSHVVWWGLCGRELYRAFVCLGSRWPWTITGGIHLWLLLTLWQDTTRFPLSHSFTSGQTWAREPDLSILLKMTLWHLWKEAVRVSLSYNDTYYCEPTFELFYITFLVISG